jgi:hypothetical protein
LLGDNIRYIAETKPSWLSLNANTGELSGIPRGVDVGERLIKIKVVDKSGLYDTIGYVLEVEHVNHAPYFSKLSYPDSIVVDGEYEVIYEVRDQDTELFGDVLSVEFEQVPSYAELRINEGKVILRPKTKDYAMGSNRLVIKVTDNQGSYKKDTIDFRIIHKNHPPKILVRLDTIKCYEDSLFSYVIDYDDEDKIVGDSVRVETQIDKSWLRYEKERKEYLGIPRIKDVGVTSVRLKVTDNEGLSDSIKFYVKVKHVNHAPKIIGIKEIDAKQDLLFQTNVLFDDVDYLYNLDNIKFYLIEAPDWITIDTLTGELSGIPTYNNLNKNRIRVKITDIYNKYDEATFTINVAKKNRIVKFEYPKDIIFTDSLFEFNIKFQDSIFYKYYEKNYASGVKLQKKNTKKIFNVNFDSINIVILYKPEWLNYDNRNKKFYGIPNYKKIGIDSLKFIIDFLDGNIFNALLLFDIHLKNSPPKLVEKNDLIAKQGEIIYYQLKAVDKDTIYGDKVFYRLKNDSLYNWVSIDYLTGILKIFPTKNEKGNYNIKILLSDLNGAVVEDSILVTVLERKWFVKTNIPDTLFITEGVNFFYRIKLEDSIYYVNKRMRKNNDILFNIVEKNKISNKKNKNINEEDNIVKNICIDSLPQFLKFDKKELNLYGKPNKLDCKIYHSNLLYTNDFGDVFKKKITFIVKRYNYKPLPVKILLPSDVFTYDKTKLISQKIVIKWNKSYDDNYNDTITYSIVIKNDGNIFKFETSDTSYSLPLSLFKKNSSVELKLFISDNYDMILSDSILININDIEKEIPKLYYLEQNFPNPFNSTTRIKFGLPEPANVKFTLFDMLGRKIFILINEKFSEGVYTKDINFNELYALTSGIYLLDFEAVGEKNRFNKVIKIVYLK